MSGETERNGFLEWLADAIPEAAVEGNVIRIPATPCQHAEGYCCWLCCPCACDGPDCCGGTICGGDEGLA